MSNADRPHNHAEHSHHPHAHGHAHDAVGQRLWLALLLTLGYAAIEAAMGWWSGSLVLLGDSGHMLTDSIALGLAALASRFARWPASVRHSYGLQRIEVLTGLLNALLMLGVILALGVAAIQRLLAPIPVHGEAVSLVAFIGLMINIAVALMLAGGAQNFNTRAALLHVMGDLLGSLAAMLAGLVIAFTDWTPIDPILSLLIALLILASTLRLLHETLHTLMEGVPRHLSVADIGRGLLEQPGVVSVDDLHLWSLSSHQIALSAHLVIDDLEHWQDILPQVTNHLHAQGIQHLTLQPEPQHWPVRWNPPQPKAP